MQDTPTIEVDGAGDAYLSGDTNNSAYPTTPGAFDTSHSPIDGSGCVRDEAERDRERAGFSTFLGNATYQGLPHDSSGNAYVTGELRFASGFPVTPGAYDTIDNGEDSYVTKLSPTGASLIYSTYLGRNDNDDANDVAVDAQGNAYVTGFTTSSNFPRRPGLSRRPRSATDSSPTGNPVGSGLVYSTYIAANALGLEQSTWTRPARRMSPVPYATRRSLRRCSPSTTHMVVKTTPMSWS